MEYIASVASIYLEEKEESNLGIPDKLNFATGVTVNILMEDGTVFTGELIDAVRDFLLVRLTAASGPYVAAQVIRLDMDNILAIG